MSGKRNVSVCSGHELANALYTRELLFRKNAYKQTIPVARTSYFICYEINTKHFEVMKNAYKMNTVYSKKNCHKFFHNEKKLMKKSQCRGNS